MARKYRSRNQRSFYRKLRRVRCARGSDMKTLTKNLPEAVRELQSSDLPSDIYLPLVDSLYKDGRTLLIGSVMVVGSVVTTFAATGEIWLLACAVAFAVVAGLRGVLMRSYASARDGIKTNDQARSWEQRYTAGAAASVGLL